MSTRRVVVVGAGVVGLLTAAECVRLGAHVDIVDAGDIPEPTATSYDRQRVVRALHPHDARLTAAAARAQAGWVAVRRWLGATHRRRHLYRVGSLTALPPDRVRSNVDLLAAAGVPAAAIRPAELAERYPMLRFPAGLAAVLEPEAGVVPADRTLTALARWLAEQPTVRLHRRRRVVEVGDDGVVRSADGSTLAGDRVVVAVGPWSRDLLPAPLAGRLVLYRQSMLSYAPGSCRSAWVDTPAVPVLGDGRGAWLIPPVGNAPVRLSAASACRAVPELTDRATPDHWRDVLVAQFRPLLTRFEPAAVAAATDGYYLADPDGTGPLLVGGADATVWTYAACGGMSFKFAPLIAQALADRALGTAVRPTGLAGVDHPVSLQGRTA